MLFWDLTFVVLLPALALVMWANHQVRSAYARFSRVGVRSGISGAEAARLLLERAGVSGVGLVPVEGELSDHYDPRNHQVRLSRGVYSGSSIAAVGVAAHEVGHSIQHARNYAPLALRTNFVPLGNFGQYLGPVVFFIGLWLRTPLLMNIGILAFSAALALILITLPVEFNASSRAIRLLRETGLVATAEEAAVKKVLRAAAFTYVATAAYTVAWLVRLLVLRSARD